MGTWSDYNCYRKSDGHSPLNLHFKIAIYRVVVASNSDAFSLFCQYCKSRYSRRSNAKSLGVQQFEGFFQVRGIGGFQS